MRTATAAVQKHTLFRMHFSLTGEKLLIQPLIEREVDGLKMTKGSITMIQMLFYIVFSLFLQYSYKQMDKL